MPSQIMSLDPIPAKRVLNEGRRGLEIARAFRYTRVPKPTGVERRRALAPMVLGAALAKRMEAVYR